MLHQEINLYSPFKKTTPQIGFLPWKKLWLMNGFFALFLLLLYLGFLWDAYQLKEKKTILANQLERLQKKFFQIKSTYPPEFFSQGMGKSLKELETALNSQEKTIETIANQTEFSQILTALGELIVPNVWLTEIIITKGGREIVLKGKNITMESLQSFYNKIGQNKIFSDSNVNINDLANLNKDMTNKNFTFELTISKKII